MYSCWNGWKILRRINEILNSNRQSANDISKEEILASNPAELCNINLYRFGPLIGSSCENSVNIYAAERKDTKKPVAIRCVNLEYLKIPLSLLEDELQITGRLHHPNILSFLCSFTNDSYIFTVTNHMSYGSCRDLLHAHFKGGLPEQAIAYILKETLRGLAYLHKQNIVHRSLRGSHILVGSQGRVKLSGLRYCRAIDHLEPTHLSSGRRVIHDFPDVGFQSSLIWASPELLEQNLAGYTVKSDIYSLGITACELANGGPPFDDMPKMRMLLEKINGIVPMLEDSKTVPSCDRTFSNNFHLMVESCLRLDAHTRPRAVELLHDDFFKVTKKRSISEALPELLLPIRPLSRLERGHESDYEFLSNEMNNITCAETIEWSF
ncbi:DgyrCDS10858 [Dimorphilus gyrociliatus]|uniref:DgyrCDS10858 n=1 Tax=Dimorphilus gyrociliatus TaxID=2664684 RepID=A0A7I8W1L0_9ANNE|nr:DgyrCDS10858 [Dimorphilus gyrociliatus]